MATNKSAKSFQRALAQLSHLPPTASDGVSDGSRRRRPRVGLVEVVMRMSNERFKALEVVFDAEFNPLTSSCRDDPEKGGGGGGGGGSLEGRVNGSPLPASPTPVYTPSTILGVRG